MVRGNGLCGGSGGTWSTAGSHVYGSGSVAFVGDALNEAQLKQRLSISSNETNELSEDNLKARRDAV
jgi:hypothetical protein